MMKKSDTSSLAPACWLPAWAYALGLLAIVVAFSASGALVYQHLTGNALPGCGGGTQQTGGMSVGGEDTPKSACGSLESHVLGSLGGLVQGARALAQGRPMGSVSPQDAVWPTSLTGTAYFAGVLCAWLVIGLWGRVVPSAVRWGLWIGGLLSVGFLVVIVIERKYCQYCITSHAGNMLLILAMEVGMAVSARRTGAGASSKVGLGKLAIIAGLAGALVSSGAMGFLESRRLASAASASLQKLGESQRDIQAKIADDKAQAAASLLAPTPEKDWGSEGFKARWTTGPAQAQVRIVIISSYQCPDCRLVEAEAVELLEKYKDKVSLGAMHFPLCPDCNKYVKGTNLHPNGCWAARVAETAGLLKGNEGFWKAHKWLFEIKGTFNDEQLKAGIKTLGFEEASFLAILGSDASLRPLEKDIDVGERLGLYFTPMIFVNGVELRGWMTPRALTTAVEGALAANPPAATASNDQPELASKKFVDDWRLAPVRSMGQSRAERSIGKPDAPVKVVIFGDYTEPNTKTATEMLVKWARAGEKPIHVTWRQFPGDKSCNTALPKTFFVNGCLAAKAAEAAGVVGGADGFWKMHDWLFAYPDKDKLSESVILDAAAGLGLEPSKLRTAMASGPVGVAIENDMSQARSVGVTQIPAIYINDRFVQRWIRENDNVLERIIAEAAKGK